MGSSTTFFIGPYIRIDTTPAPLQITLACCNNTGCSELHKFSQQNFCGKCGTLISMGTFEVSESRRWSDFDEATNYEHEVNFYAPQNLCTETEDIVICHEDGEYVHTGNENIIPLTPNFIHPDRIRAFEIRHKDMLEEMRRFFAPGKTSIEFGACAYWG